jgi:hypothetical protein
MVLKGRIVATASTHRSKVLFQTSLKTPAATPEPLLGNALDSQAFKRTRLRFAAFYFSKTESSPQLDFLGAC